MLRLVPFLLVAATLTAQPNRMACEMTGETAATFQALPATTDVSKSWEQRMAPRRAMTAPDWPLQIALQDPLMRQLFMGREWDLAIERYRKLPDRALGQLLEGRLLAGWQRQRSRELLEQARAAALDSPWVHLAMLEWAGHPLRRDADLAAREFEEFRRLCPASSRPFLYLDVVRDTEKFARHLRDLRGMIEEKKKKGLSEADLPLFRPAWTWEAVLAGEKEREQFESAVRADLAALRALWLPNSMEWASHILIGYERELKDAAAVRAFQEEVLAKAPLSYVAWSIEEERTQGKVDMAALRQRVERYGDRPIAKFNWQMLLHDRASTNEEYARAADRVLKLTATHPDLGMSFPPIEFLIAEEFAHRKIELARVPALLDQGLQAVEFAEKYRRASDVVPAAKPGEGNVDTAQRRARLVLIRVAQATGQAERAHALLGEMRQTLFETRPANPAGRPSLWNRDHDQYMELAKASGLEVEPLTTAQSAGEEQERIAVKNFEAKDLNGKTWRLSDLKGKAAYVNVWTTWCGPCREEMPALEKLHQAWKDRPDRVVLTISADIHADLPRQFLREHKYSFPVIHGRETAESFFPPVYFPQNWLITPAGERMGMRAPEPAQLQRIEELVKKLTSGR